MARNPSSYARRQRELARQRKRAEKAKRKAERRDRRAELDENEEQVDPDIAGIVPGPQPLPYDENGFTEDTEPSEEDDDEATPQN